MPGWGVTKFDKTPRMPPERQRIAIGGSGGYIVLRLYEIGGGGFHWNPRESRTNNPTSDLVFTQIYGYIA